MHITTDSLRVAVIGSSNPPDEDYVLGYEIGTQLAKANAILVCGGGSGVMEAASKGANEHGGLVIGLLPDLDRSSANPYVTIPIGTSLGPARNALVVANSDVVIALNGAYGTLSEIVYALQFGRPVLAIGEWDLPGVTHVTSVTEAVTIALQYTPSNSSNEL